MGNHLVADACQLGDKGWDLTAGINQRGPLLFHPATVKTNGPNLQYGFSLGIEASGFDI
jgi:hypothetical protein